MKTAALEGATDASFEASYPHRLTGPDQVVARPSFGAATGGNAETETGSSHGTCPIYVSRR
jgi:hypothetical protein